MALTLSFVQALINIWVAKTEQPVPHADDQEQRSVLSNRDAPPPAVPPVADAAFAAEMPPNIPNGNLAIAAPPPVAEVAFAAEMPPNIPNGNLAVAAAMPQHNNHDTDSSDDIHDHSSSNSSTSSSVASSNDHGNYVTQLKTITIGHDLLVEQLKRFGLNNASFPSWPLHTSANATTSDIFRIALYALFGNDQGLNTAGLDNRHITHAVNDAQRASWNVGFTKYKGATVSDLFAATLATNNQLPHGQHPDKTLMIVQITFKLVHTEPGYSTARHGNEKNIYFLYAKHTMFPTKHGAASLLGSRFRDNAANNTMGLASKLTNYLFPYASNNRARDIMGYRAYYVYPVQPAGTHTVAPAPTGDDARKPSPEDRHTKRGRNSTKDGARKRQHRT